MGNAVCPRRSDGSTEIVLDLRFVWPGAAAATATTTSQPGIAMQGTFVTDPPPRGWWYTVEQWESWIEDLMALQSAARSRLREIRESGQTGGDSGNFHLD